MQPIIANIQDVGELDFKKFDIPFYQRPYRWQTSHVETLLSTIRDSMDKEEYRIGSIILNPNLESGKLDVVDGQQRLTTLSLIFMCLEDNSPYKLTCQYRHVESKQNIYRNYRYIKNWINRPDFDKDRFKEFILKQCTVVVITAQNLSEAFQMFDSQNGRGKELEAYNLLKAYHLRAIDNENTQIDITPEKIAIDRDWEAAVLMKAYGSDRSLLKYLMNELYRIRQWCKLQRGGYFGKSKIKEFKGIQFNKRQSELPLHNRSFLLYMYFMESLNVAKRSDVENTGQNPFVSIDMDIINGRLFFTYVQTYVAAYNYLFKSEVTDGSPILQFRRDFDKYCLGYGGSHRTGDIYIREMYVALIVALYDRFGEDYVKRWYKTLYILSYRLRLESESVFYNSIEKYIKDNNYFSVIATAIDEAGLEELRNHSINMIQCKKLGAREYEIARFIVNCGGRITASGSNVTINGNTIAQGTLINKDYFGHGEN
ncbi:MAG: DUF262 domain-containing protein [Muribaculaceae bacterium]|nr:DUF262 domain-containing protein [Muribaculaceae bacterium]